MSAVYMFFFILYSAYRKFNFSSWLFMKNNQNMYSGDINYGYICIKSANLVRI